MSAAVGVLPAISVLLNDTLNQQFTEKQFWYIFTQKIKASDCSFKVFCTKKYVQSSYAL